MPLHPEYKTPPPFNNNKLKKDWSRIGMFNGGIENFNPTPVGIGPSIKWIKNNQNVRKAENGPDVA